MTLAFVFPGQGSQSVGMLAEMADLNTIIHKTFAEASELLGYNLWQLIQEGPESDLNETRCTQPAMLTAGVAVWRLWQAQGGAEPRYMAGHSLGEYTALVCAGALGFAEAVKLVERRGQDMQAAVPTGSGAMAAILGLDDEQVAEVCRQAASDGHVAPANYNAPGQVVIAGDRAAVERAVDAAKTAGARRAVVLPVSVPSHCELMRPAAKTFAEALAAASIKPPGIPVIHNADVSEHTEPESIRRVLTEQLYQPVRWVETIRTLQSLKVQCVIECGPGKILTGLNKRIERGLESMPVQDPDTLTVALNTVSAD